MLAQIGFVLAMVAVVVAVGRISRWSSLPDAVLLTVIGLVYAVLPGPNLLLSPEVVLDLVIPPLLYHAALGSSLLALRSRLRTVVSLSVVLVMLTAVVTGGLLAWLVPEVPLAAAVALGAAVAPPDPVAALAVGRTVGLPAKLSTLIEGEGLLNDATALTTFQVAVAAAVGGGFSFGDAAGRFALSAVGGLVIGVVVASLVRLSRRLASDPLSVNAVSLVTPFAAFAAGDAAHVSGVLAVVVAGLIVGHNSPRLQAGASRLQASAVWDLVNFLLEGFVFLLIGQQLAVVVKGLGAYGTGTIAVAAAVTVGAVLTVRPVWLVLTQHVPRWLHSRLGGEDDAGAGAGDDAGAGAGDDVRAGRERPLSGREIGAMSWAGTRGVITLSAAFAIPVSTAAGHPFPARDLLLFLAYLVVLVTLLGQGLTLGPLLRRLGLGANPVDQARLRNEARTAAVQAALSRLDQLAEEDELPGRVVREMRRGLIARLDRYQRRLEFLEENPATLRTAGYEAAIRARRAVIDAQHEELLRWRDAGRLPDTGLRVLQRELDHEERMLPLPSS
ncbi:MAG TPA: cation:proton antiporter [Trebonia sp.]